MKFYLIVLFYLWIASPLAHACGGGSEYQVVATRPSEHGYDLMIKVPNGSDPNHYSCYYIPNDDGMVMALFEFYYLGTTLKDSDHEIVNGCSNYYGKTFKADPSVKLSIPASQLAPLKSYLDLITNGIEKDAEKTKLLSFVGGTSIPSALAASLKASIDLNEPISAKDWCRIGFFLSAPKVDYDFEKYLTYTYKQNGKDCSFGDLKPSDATLVMSTNTEGNGDFEPFDASQDISKGRFHGTMRGCNGKAVGRPSELNSSSGSEQTSPAVVPAKN